MSMISSMNNIAVDPSEIKTFAQEYAAMGLKLAMARRNQQQLQQKRSRRINKSNQVNDIICSHACVHGQHSTSTSSTDRTSRFPYQQEQHAQQKIKTFAQDSAAMALDMARRKMKKQKRNKQ
jgi:hypothetical protein